MEAGEGAVSTGFQAARKPVTVFVRYLRERVGG
jgi:hypothetical protein